MSKHNKQNRDTFTQQFRQLENSLYRMAYVYVKNEQDALDVMQETAYRAYKNYHTLQNPQYFKTWVTRILINCAVDCIRKKQRYAAIGGLCGKSPGFSHRHCDALLRCRIHLDL